jgi:2-(1,2-epoxy-1,2-dihydrophenyl)acetyl-CoA isomerase
MEHVHIERTGPIGTVVIDRRERFNSLDVATARELRRASLQLARDADVRVMVLRGVPGVFCSGVDLKDVQAGGDRGELGYLSPEARPVPKGHGEVFKQVLEYLHSAISEIRRASKPVIAAVDGTAAAGGFGLAMACDLVFASERASFEWAYGRTGLTGAESSTFLLPRLLGLRRAMELALLNPRLGARRALQLGLVNDVFETDAFDAEVAAMARQLGEGPTAAYAAAKALLNEATGMDRLDFHLDRELQQLARAADGPEFAEGLAAFLDKRTARFGGR